MNEKIEYIINPVVMSEDIDPTVYSALPCPNCSSYVAEGTTPFSVCTECNHALGGGSGVFPDVLHSSSHLLSKETAQEVRWFHATTVTSWHERLLAGFNADTENYDDGTLYVHVGTEAAALDIAHSKHLAWNGGDKVYFYELALKSDCVLSDDLLKDLNDWFFKVTPTTKRILNGDAIRYVNRWESCGSISLLVDPRMLEVKKVSTIDKSSITPR